MEDPSILTLHKIQELNIRNLKFTPKKNIKFELISRESLPYLSNQVTRRNSLCKGFLKKEQKENSSFHYAPQFTNRKSLGQVEEEMKWKERLKMEKLCNMRNFEKSKLKRHYENLRINSIIEEASKSLIEKQNVLLKGI